MIPTWVVEMVHEIIIALGDKFGGTPPPPFH